MISFLAISGALLTLAAGTAGQAVDPPATPGAMGPNLVAVGGTLLLSWLEPMRPGARPAEGNLALRYAIFDGTRWSAARTVLSGPKFLANWADFPAIASASPGWLLAAWPERSGAGDYDYNLQLARAASAGGPWRRVGPAHEDDTQAEHGFASLVPEGEAIRAFWLDGRNMKGDKGSMSLRTTRIAERPEPSQLLDARVCDCCQTAAAVTSEGSIVVYRDRSDEEVRDISIIRRSGGEWTAPRSVAEDHWKIGGCPVNGPAVAASGKRVGVAWFTAEGERPRVRVAFSKDAGASFGKPVEVDEAGSAGRVGIVLEDGGGAIVCFVAAEGKAAAIRVRRVGPDGRSGAPLSVAPTSLARSSGVPRIARYRDTLVVAWVDAGEPFRLRAFSVPLAAIPRPE